MDLAEDLKLGIQIYPHTKEEVFPTLKKFSKVALEEAEANGTSLTKGGVKVDRQYTECDDPDQKPVPTEQ